MTEQTAQEWQAEKYQRAFAHTEAIPLWNSIFRDGDFCFSAESMQRIIAARELLLLEITRAKVLRTGVEVTGNIVEVNFRGLANWTGDKHESECN